MINPGKADAVLAVIKHSDLADAVEQGGMSLKQAYVAAVDRHRGGPKVTTSTKKCAPQKKLTPWPQMKFPTHEETGFPINGTLAEKDAHHKKYGRTPMHPKEVKDMLNNAAWVEAYVGAISLVTSDSHPGAEAFCSALDQMLAWVPRPEKGDDWKINFAAKATKSLALIEQRLPVALSRLTELSNALKERSK